ncbi:MAG: shikimate dehydrogenase [Alistipes sp.]|nr:shikimate dehydrogenase [Alistipes sp.]
MKHFALIGFPLGHSLSASYFTEKFSREGIEADYTPLPIENAEEVLPHCAKLSGFNVTIPHKQSIIPLLANISEEARAVGAVNCVKVTPQGLVGYNTDVIGIRKSLERIRLDGAKTLVLGTGGASKAVQYVLREGGAEVKVVSRSKGSADLTYEDLTDELLRNCDIIVNTTPLGMFPNVDSAPTLPYSALSAKHTLFDCVYNPRQTKFLQLGAEQGAHTIDGLTMFYAQAEASWKIWEFPKML